MQFGLAGLSNVSCFSRLWCHGVQSPVKTGWLCMVQGADMLWLVVVSWWEVVTLGRVTPPYEIMG
jgi:hypothetical protein